MTNQNVENLILEHFRVIRADMSSMKEEMSGMRAEMTAMRQHLTGYLDRRVKPGNDDN